MKTYEIDFTWEEMGCSCDLCRSSRGPHKWTSKAHITCQDDSEAAGRARDHVKSTLPPGTKFTIQSVSFVCDGEFSPLELSLMAEAEMLGLDKGDEAPKNWLNQLAAVGLRPDLDRIVNELVHPDGREKILACIDVYGLEGHQVMEAVAALMLEGKTKDGNQLYRQFKNLAIRLQE